MIPRLILSLGVVLTLSSCVNSPRIHEAVTPPTIGHELMDAWRAVGEGALTEAQYLVLKERLLKTGRSF